MTHFGLNSRITDPSGDFLSKVGGVYLDNKGVLFCVTAMLNTKAKKPQINGVDLQPYRSKNSPEVEHLEATSAQNLLGLLEIPKELVLPDLIDLGAIWPREYAPAEQMMFEPVFDTRSSDHQTPIGQVTQCFAAVFLGQPNEPEKRIIATNTMVVKLFDQRFEIEEFAGAALIDSAARHVGVCIGRRRDADQRVEELLLAPPPQSSGNNEFTLWAPPGAHWFDLGFRSQNFADRVKQETMLDLGTAP